MRREVRGRMVTTALVVVLAALLVGVPAATGGTPTTTNPMGVAFVAGTHTGYRFDSAWRVVATKSATLARPSGAPATARRSIPNRGIHLRISAGIWAGYWVKESTLAYIRGIPGEATYSPPTSVRFAAGTYIGYRFDGSWRLSGTKTARLNGASSAAADRRAVINGRPYVRMSNGIWAGTWIPGTPANPSGVACTAGPRPAAGTRQVYRAIPSAGREIALTFDMGGRLDPALAIMDYLLLERVCTTIFPTGVSARTTTGRAVMARIAAHPELFEVGNHTQRHCNLRDGGGGATCPAAPPSEVFIRRELTDAATVIRQLVGQSPAPYWRPPYGAYDTRVLAAAAAAGSTKTFMWSIDTIDWRPVKNDPLGPTADEIARKVRSNASAGAIVLMHLGGYNTLDALPDTLVGLRAAGYQATSISDLLRAG